jgi:hypothetical protein
MIRDALARVPIDQWELGAVTLCLGQEDVDPCEAFRIVVAFQRHGRAFQGNPSLAVGTMVAVFCFA